MAYPARRQRNRDSTRGWRSSSAHSGSGSRSDGSSKYVTGRGIDFHEIYRERQSASTTVALRLSGTLVDSAWYPTLWQALLAVDLLLLILVSFDSFSLRFSRLFDAVDAL